MTDKERARKHVRAMQIAKLSCPGTCPSSRHTAMMAQNLGGYGQYPMLNDAPYVCAGTIAVTVTKLWKAVRILHGLGYHYKPDAMGRMGWRK